MAPTSTTRPLIIHLLSTILVMVTPVVRAQDRITAQELAALSQADQVAVMQAFIEHCEESPGYFRKPPGARLAQRVMDDDSRERGDLPSLRHPLPPRSRRPLLD